MRMRTDFLSDPVCPRLSRIATVTLAFMLARPRARTFRSVASERLSANRRRPGVVSRRVTRTRRVVRPRPALRAVVRVTVSVAVARHADEHPTVTVARPRTRERSTRAVGFARALAGATAAAGVAPPSGAVAGGVLGGGGSDPSAWGAE